MKRLHEKPILETQVFQVGHDGTITFSERIYTWLLDEKPINYNISDM